MKETLSDKRKELEQKIVNGEIDIRSVFVLIKEQDRGFIQELKKKIKERKWVWNEEKFGNVRAHKMFDEYMLELMKEIDKLAGEELAAASRGNHSPQIAREHKALKHRTREAPAEMALSKDSPQDTAVQVGKRVSTPLPEDTHSPQATSAKVFIGSSEPKTKQTSPEDTQKGCAKEIEHLQGKYAMDEAFSKEEFEDTRKGCEICNGRGMVKNISELYVPCPACSGDGE